MTNTRLLALLLPLSLAACTDEAKDEGTPEGADGASDGADGADGTADGAPSNSPPTTATVALSPERPTTDQDATVVIVAGASDPDGDGLTYRYVWFQDGVLRADLTTDTLPASETTKGEVWTVSVVATDGALDGGAAEAEATVVNSPPTASISLPAAVNTEAELVATVEGIDADGDPVTFALSWTVDGAPTSRAGAAVPASETRRGQVWALTATPSDDEGEGAPVTAEVLIENGLPTIASVELGPDPAFEGSELRATVLGAADMDGDALSFAYAWSVNGALVAGAAGDRLSGADFDKGDAVVVRVTVSDPVGAGDTAESAPLRISNSLPSGSGASIGPLPVYEASTVSCLPTGWSDADGDPEGWRFAWTVNGVAAGATSTLSGASFSKGDRLVCTATPDDGEGLGSALSSASVVVSNTPPVLASAALSTLSPTESDTLSVILGAMTDGDGDTVVATYAWRVNGSLVGTGATLAPSRFAKNDRISVTVTPFDGADLGAPVTSAEATAANSAPAVGTVSLSPASPRTNDSLSASALGSDPDGDPVSLSYAWTVNGAPVSASSSSLSGLVYFDKGDVVQVTLTPSDGTAVGASRSASVTVQNTPPTAPVARISPAEPIEGEALVCEIVTAANDADGDSLSYAFAWEVDGVAYSGASSTLRSGDTVLAGETLPDELWTCAVRATDGSASGPAGEDDVLVEADCINDGSVTLTSSGVQFVTVCGGTFDMGCTPGQSSCYADESPVRTTTLTRDYYMSRTEVTQGQFQALMGYNPSYHSSCGSTCPVEQVTWHMAARFTNAMSAASGLPACYSCSGSGASVTCTAPSSVYSCTGYRLPTEAEWEGAARCGEDLLYAGSNTVGAVAWYTANSGIVTKPVAGRADNACGLYDMSGNIWEWTQDWYGPYGSSAEVDPTGAGSATDRIFRGGAYGDSASLVRSAFRGGRPPTHVSPAVGLRVVRSLP